MNKSIRQKDLSNAEKRMYNKLSLDPRIKINCATDCDAAIDDSHSHPLIKLCFHALPGAICAIAAILHIFADQFFWGVFLFFGVLSAFFIFSTYSHRKMRLVQLPRAILAYKNERFGNE